MISLRGVRVHNLQNINVEIPLGKLTVVTGVSGAGKSSLVFNTLYSEAQRRYLQSVSVSARQFLERFDKPDAESIGELPAAIAVHGAVAGDTTVGALTEIGAYLAMILARAGIVHCPGCGNEVRTQGIADLEASLLALPTGTRVTLAFPGTPETGAEAAWASGLVEEGFVRVQVADQVYRLDEGALPPKADFAWVLVDRLQAGQVAAERLIDSAETAFRRGDDRLALLWDGQTQVFDRRLRCSRCDVELTTPQPRLFERGDPLALCGECRGTGTLKAGTTCTACRGNGWSEAALSVRLAGLTVAELWTMPLTELAARLDALPRSPAIAPALDAIARRLRPISEIGLNHLALARTQETLSTGETRRLRLCAAIASELVGVLYLLDEPTAGLHPQDRSKLLVHLQRLAAAGNTLVAVEHDRALIRAADWAIDLGPGAAEEGGRVVFQGRPDQFVGAADSLTADFLSGRAAFPQRDRRRHPTAWLRLEQARLNNLQNLSVAVPLGVLCVVTGVSGAGKSSLVHGTLYPLLAQAKKKKERLIVPPGTLRGAGNVGDVALLDQTPLPRSARSNPATFLKIFDDVRDLFAETIDAKIRNFGPGHFSFNQPGGRCEHCEGQGTLSVEMQFLPDVLVTCPECQGRRYKNEVLAIKVRSLSIAEVLDLSVREAFRFFRAQHSVQHKLKRLIDVGLEYLRLGQAIDTLSAGEAQRLRLAGHLASSRKPSCLFILMEPTAGLHPADTERLLACFDQLLDAGHSLVIVEHNLDVIRYADYVIDLGPGAGPAGGRIVAQGTPEEIAACPDSATGRWLQNPGLDA